MDTAEIPRLSYLIPNFTYPRTPPALLYDKVVAQAVAAEAAGFQRLMVNDHLYQLQPAGHPHEPMLESQTLLAALSQRTERMQLAALVTGNTYRNPALVAKSVTALDHVSGGRAGLGIGSGWYQLEHDAFGFHFGTTAERFDRLEEALAILQPLLAGQVTSFVGQHYRVADVVNSPAPLSPIPITVGGSGERRTLRLAAEFANESNLLGPVEETTRKLDALADHCGRIGRNRDSIAVTRLTRVCLAPTMEDALADLQRAAQVKRWSHRQTELAQTHLVFGDPDTVGEELQRHLDLGLDGLVVSLPANGDDPERVELAGELATTLALRSSRV